MEDREDWRRRCRLFAGSAHPTLAEEVAQRLGVPVSAAKVARFADSEVAVELLESVRGRDVFLLQPICRGFPNSSVNDALVELTLFISAVRRASAQSITAILPYYGYARQDRRVAQVPIAAADVAQILTNAGVNRVVAMDLHSGQLQGFFPPSVPVDHLSAVFVAAGYFAEQGLHHAVVVSPDAGGVSRAKEFGATLQSVGRQIDGTQVREGVQKLAMLVKQRSGASQIERMDLVGSVEGEDVILVDDILDTAGTLCGAAAECKRYGARRVYAFCTHGLFSGDAPRRLAEASAAGHLEYVVVANTVPQRPLEEWTSSCGALPAPQVRVLSVAALLAEVVKRLASKQNLDLRFASKL